MARGISFVSGEGINQIEIKVYDVAGNVASRSLEIKVDTTPPSISTSIAGTKGWRVGMSARLRQRSQRVMTTPVWIVIEYNQNAEGWQDGVSVESNDGVNTIEIRAYDVAGNVTTDALEIKVDTIAPPSSRCCPFS